MRLTYAFKIWFMAILIGYVGLLVIPYFINNLFPPESASYANEAIPWYLQLYSRTDEIFRYLLLVTFPFFLGGMAVYKEPGAETNQQVGVFSFSSLKSRSMLPAYGTFLLSLIFPYFFIPRESHGVDSMFANIMTAIFIYVIIPVNLHVLIKCIKRSKQAE